VGSACAFSSSLGWFFLRYFCLRSYICYLIFCWLLGSATSVILILITRTKSIIKLEQLLEYWKLASFCHNYIFLFFRNIWHSISIDLRSILEEMLSSPFRLIIQCFFIFVFVWLWFHHLEYIQSNLIGNWFWVWRKRSMVWFEQWFELNKSEVKHFSPSN
jgi:hypothetical protein